MKKNYFDILWVKPNSDFVLYIYYIRGINDDGHASYNHLIYKK